MTAAWYYHADVLFHRTGLGVAIFHGVGGYSKDVMEGSGTVTLVSSWNTLHQLRDREFYWTLADRFWKLHFTPLGTIVILFTAAFLWRLPNRRFVDVWCASVVLFILAAAEGNRWHEFYQLPILLPAALYFGLGARPLFDGRLLASLAPLKIGVAISAALLTVAAFRSFDYSRAVPELFRPNNLRMHPMRVGTMLQRLTPPDALLITTEYARFGGNSPVLLHYARRRGWSFDAGTITPAVIERLRTRYGARYFVSLNWEDIERLQPDVVAYLKKYVDIPVAAIDTRLASTTLRDPSKLAVDLRTRSSHRPRGSGLWCDVVKDRQVRRSRGDDEALPFQLRVGVVAFDGEPHDRAHRALARLVQHGRVPDRPLGNHEAAL